MTQPSDEPGSSGGTWVRRESEEKGRVHPYKASHHRDPLVVKNCGLPLLHEKIEDNSKERKKKGQKNQSVGEDTHLK